MANSLALFEVIYVGRAKGAAHVNLPSPPSGRGSMGKIKQIVI